MSNSNIKAMFIAAALAGAAPSPVSAEKSPPNGLNEKHQCILDKFHQARKVPDNDTVVKFIDAITASTSIEGGNRIEATGNLSDGDEKIKSFTFSLDLTDKADFFARVIIPGKSQTGAVLLRGQDDGRLIMNSSYIKGGNSEGGGDMSLQASVDQIHVTIVELTPEISVKCLKNPALPGMPSMKL